MIPSEVFFNVAIYGIGNRFIRLYSYDKYLYGNLASQTLT